MKRKIFQTLRILTTLSLLFLSTQKTYAASCSFDIDQSTQVKGSSSIKINSITSSDFASGANYKVSLSGDSGCNAIGGGANIVCPTTTQSLKGNALTNLTLNYIPNPYDYVPGHNGFIPGKYVIHVSDTRFNTDLCSQTFTIAGATQNNQDTSCEVNILGDFKPSSSLNVHITGALASNTGVEGLHISLGTTDSHQEIWTGDVKRTDVVNGLPLSPLPTGIYTILIQNQTPFGIGRQTFCNTTFTISPSGGGQYGGGPGATPPSPCFQTNKDGVCTTVNTDLLGKVGTQPLDLVTSIFGLILGLSGGIAILLIMMSGYRILASQGNPEGLKGAKEQLTAALVGLLFIIFSLIILQIIGVNILHIPGFSSPAPIERRGGP